MLEGKEGRFRESWVGIAVEWEPPSNPSPLRALICKPWGMADQKAISATITGRVQGVGFRFAAARFARDHGVTGWVRNAARGTVEVWAQGDEATLDQFVVFLRQGPRAANVKGMTVLPATLNPGIEAFNVRH